MATLAGRADVGMGFGLMHSAKPESQSRSSGFRNGRFPLSSTPSPPEPAPPLQSHTTGWAIIGSVGETSGGKDGELISL